MLGNSPQHSWASLALSDPRGRGAWGAPAVRQLSARRFCTPASGSGREVLASACLQAKNPGSEEVSAALESGPEARGLRFLSRVHSLVYCFMLWLLTSDSERSSGSFGERKPGKVRGRGGRHLPEPRARRQVWRAGGGHARSLPGRGKSRREGSEVGAARVPGKPGAETVA